MVDEIGNFYCSQCDEPIKHADLGEATVKLAEPIGVVLVCAE